MGSQRVRGPREPRGDRVPEATERNDPLRAPGRAHDRGGIDGVAGGLPTRAPRGPGLRTQMEHGLDAQHAQLLLEGTHLPPLPPQQPDVLTYVRVLREFRVALVARRGRPRQGLDDPEDAGGRMAEVREPA